MVGETVGKYRVVARLGRGGMGTVYKAVDETLGREVAIKSLNADVADAALLKRFRAEAVTLARLNHPNIATLFELSEHDGQLLMIMEFVRGETLDRMTQHSGALPVERAARLSLQVLDALGHAHQAGVVHRDLKPANLMLTESGLVKIMDFGLARMVGTEHLTNDGFMVGTPAYMAPEQVLGREIDGRSDLYAMGVVLYRLLTTHLPFTAESGIAMVQSQINEEPTPARRVRPDLPERVEQILNRALAKAPGDRYQTADEFKSALMPMVGNLSSADMPLPSGIVEALSGISPMRAVHAGGARPLRDTVMAGTIADAVSAKPGTDEATSAPFTLSQANLLPATMVLPRNDAAKHIGKPKRSRAAVIAGGVALVLLVGVPTGLIVIRRAAVTRSRPEGPPATMVPARPVAPRPDGQTSVHAPTTAARASAPVRATGSAESLRSPEDQSAPPSTENADATTNPEDARSRMPVLTFGQVKLLEIGQDGRSHDHDASLRFGGDRIDVLDGTTSLQSVRYADVVGVFHSHSRDPRWTSPEGTVVTVAKVGGRFAFLKGADDWITLRTKNTFLAVRVQPEELHRLTTELQARTGQPVVQTR